MKSIVLISSFYFFVLAAIAQSRAGLTGVRDSSYNMQTEYNKHLKNFPDLKMVPEIPAHVVAKNNSPYCGNEQKQDIHGSGHIQGIPAQLHIIHSPERAQNKNVLLGNRFRKESSFKWTY